MPIDEEPRVTPSEAGPAEPEPARPEPAEPAVEAEVFALGANGPRRLDLTVLDLPTLRTELGANIDALKQVRWALPRIMFGAGADTISLDSRYTFAELIRTAGESVRLTLEAARTLFDLLPTPGEKPETPDAAEGDDRPLSLDAWRTAMSAPVERVGDLADKVALLHAVASDTDEWASGLAQILLDVELVGRSAVASLPVYDDRADEADLVDLHREWLALRTADLSDEAVLSDWSVAMAAIVDRIMLAPAWTAAGRRLKHEVLRAEITPALSAPGSALDERLPTWLAAMEVDATRRVH